MALVSLIAAIAKNRVIGKNNRLPWNLPDDLRHFHNVTQGKSFLMGRKSYETKDRLLSDHKNFILTTKKQLELCPNCQLVHSLAQYLIATQQEEEVFILGGGKVYTQALQEEIVDRMYITEVNVRPQGDAFFPKVDWNKWKLLTSTYHPKDDQHDYDFMIKVYEGA